MSQFFQLFEPSPHLFQLFLVPKLCTVGQVIHFFRISPYVKKLLKVVLRPEKVLVIFSNQCLGIWDALFRKTCR